MNLREVDDYLVFMVDSMKQPYGLPLLDNSYTLWRKWCYEKMHPVEAKEILEFYLISQCRYLRRFINKIEGKWETQSKMNVPQQFIPLHNEHWHWFDEYALSVSQLRFLNELILDLVKLPYLQQVFPPSSAYIVSGEYAWREDKIQKEGIATRLFQTGTKQTITKGLTTGVTKVMESISAKAILLPILGAINPLTLGASFGLAQGLAYYQKTKLISKMQEYFQSANTLCRQKIIALQAAFQIIIQAIAKYLQCKVKLEAFNQNYSLPIDKKQDLNHTVLKHNINKKVLTKQSFEQQNKNKFTPNQNLYQNWKQEMLQSEQYLKKTFERFVQKEWYKVKVEKDNDGWDTITIQQDDEYQIMKYSEQSQEKNFQIEEIQFMSQQKLQ